MDLTWLFIGIGLCFISFVIAALNMVLNHADDESITVHVLAMIGMVSGGVVVVVSVIMIIVHYLDAPVK